MRCNLSDESAGQEEEVVFVTRLIQHRRDSNDTVLCIVLAFGQGVFTFQKTYQNISKRSVISRYFKNSINFSDNIKIFKK